MDPMGKTSAISSKLNTLLRMGLVSKNNVRRAMTLFADPDKALKNPAYRTLMQEIMVDVVDRVVNNKSLYTTMRATLAKEPATVIEDVEKERTKTLLRTGLVKKKDVVAARRALEAPTTATAKTMGASKVYRDMMIDMMDTMVKKITGSPVLFNAFKKTMGNPLEDIEESFEVPNAETLQEFFLVEDAQTLLEKNKPTNPQLWSQAKSKARSKFDVYPSAYANGWAVKWYNEQGGSWKSVSEGKTFFDLQRELNEYMTTMNRKSPQENKKAREQARKLRDELETPKPAKKAVKECSDCMTTATETMQTADIPAAQTFKTKKGKSKKMVKEASGSEVRAKLQGLKKDYAKHADEISKPVPPARGSTHPLAQQDKKSGKMSWAADRRKKAGSGSKRASDADYRSDTTSY